MKGRQIHFFATKKDLSRIVLACEASRKLKYIRIELSDSPEVTIFNSLLEWKGFGTNLTGRTGIDNFLVFDRSETIEVREILQRKGGVKYMVETSETSPNIVLRPSGLHGENNLVAGNVGTVSSNITSVEIFNLFHKNIMENSKKIGYAYVCADAFEFMKKGGRMVTMGIDSPPEYDLKFQ